MRLSFVGVVAGTITLASCTGGTEPICLDYAQAGLIITVLDAGSGAPLRDASGVARDGEYVENLQVSDNELRGAHERPGTYRVEITRTGYVAWVRENLRVTEGRCHVRPVEMEARLQPVP